ncbi:SHC-transforming protein 4 isoform X3 [Heterocephalus glaber]|uniref:SHC-transforming protein 4 isoform X3 n=1 Tax=Heterocephalus glaber TaxID=10181 RepID=A0AAX6QWB5_HETGA|nr:SHC-transforming protein 4 isoform X3 [Heterocephalus glaber]
MRGSGQDSLTGLALCAGLSGPPGMLQRAKYSRFRNEPVQLAEEGGSKGAPQPARLAREPPEDSASPTRDGPTPLCTLVPRVASVKLANPAALLSLKNFCLGTKEAPGPRVRESRDPAPAPPPPEPCLPGPAEPSVRGRRDQPGPKQHLLGAGLSYRVRYMGCIEVLQSMRSLDFGMRTQVTREAISRLCEAVPGASGAIKKRKAPVKFLSAVLGKSNLQFSGMNIKLTISTGSLTLMKLDNQQIIANHHMQSISFASGGDPDTTDYVAYVAKDPVNQRACHILECRSGTAQDVISTIGQAFELRFKQYLRNTSLNISCESEEVQTDSPASEGEDHEYYNEIPGKQLPAGGVSDLRIRVQSPEQRAYCPIRCEKLCYLPGNSKSSSAYENCLEQSRAAEALEAVQPGATAQPTSSCSLLHIKQQLWNEDCYHGKLSRKAAESLLVKDGDFLVRESATSPGQYVLSGLQGSQAKHLLLVDPEGKVRTKDHVFDNVGHLIRYHMDNSLPIISSGSEVTLKQPVRKEDNPGLLHFKK